MKFDRRKFLTIVLFVKMRKKFYKEKYVIIIKYFLQSLSNFYVTFPYLN